MKKRPRVAIINTLEAAGAQVVDDTTAEYWSVMKASTDADALFTLLYGKVKSLESFNAVAENRQVVLIGASLTKETILASTNYGILIGNNEQDYESHRTAPIVHAMTTASALSGDADDDRTTVYQALAAKVNAYAGNNATASHLFQFTFTLGGATGNDTLTVGTTITQSTSSVTAVVGKIVLTSGSWGAGTAAGTLWVYSVSNEAGILPSAETWSYASSTLTQTVSTLVDTTGLAIIDDAGYFVSKIGRGGVNYVGVRRGFSVSTFEVAEAHAYAENVGSVMNSLRPVWDHAKLDLIQGSLEYDFQDGDVADAAKTYRKYVLTYEDGDENAIGATKESSISEVILYVDDSNGTNLGNFDSALVAAAAK